MDFIYDPLTREKYSLYDTHGKAIFKALMKSYSIKGGANKNNKKEETKEDTKKEETKEEKVATPTPPSSPSKKKGGNSFFGKHKPKDYELTELSDIIDSFLDEYDSNNRADLMEKLYVQKPSVPYELIESEAPEIPLPALLPAHSFDENMILKWKDSFVPLDKLMLSFFQKHSNCEEVMGYLKNYKKILKEEVSSANENETEEGNVEESIKMKKGRNFLNGLFNDTVGVPFWTLNMAELVKSIQEYIETQICSFIILKTPSFDSKGELDKRLLLFFLNEYGRDFYTKILDVYNNLKMAINTALQQLTESYSKQNLTSDNIDENFKIILVGNDENEQAINEHIQIFKKYIETQKLTAKDNEQEYTKPVPFYALVRIDILGDIVLTLSGDQELTYLKIEEDAVFVNNLQHLITTEGEPDKTTFFFAKQVAYKDNVSINLPKADLEKHFNISIEQYILKLLNEEKLFSK
jgi:hypothetical protein